MRITMAIGFHSLTVSFDGVVTICVMHQVDRGQRPGFVAGLRRVMRPGVIAVVFEQPQTNFEGEFEQQSQPFRFHLNW